MNLINKLSKQKKEIEAFVEENGMEEAVKKHGLSNLIRYFILTNYSKTNLYFDDRGIIDKVYTDKGVYLWSCKYCDHVTNTYSDAFGHDLNILGNCKRCDYSAVGNALGNAGNAIVDGWNNLFGGSSSGSAGAEDDEKKTLWDYITGLVPGGDSSGGSSSSEGGINTTLDGIARILSLGLVLVLGLVLFPLLKPLFQLLGDLISYGVSGVKSLSKKVKSKTKKKKNS